MIYHFLIVEKLCDTAAREKTADLTRGVSMIVGKSSKRKQRGMKNENEGEERKKNTEEKGVAHCAGAEPRGPRKRCWKCLPSHVSRWLRGAGGRHMSCTCGAASLLYLERVSVLSLLFEKNMTFYIISHDDYMIYVMYFDEKCNVKDVEKSAYQC